MTAGIGELFWEFLQIGLCSIGGGYATIPLIQAQVVEGRHWLTLQEFTDILTISQMTPGAAGGQCLHLCGAADGGDTGGDSGHGGMCTVRMCDRAAAFRGVPAGTGQSPGMVQALGGLRAASAGLIASAAASIVMLSIWLPTGGIEWRGLCLLTLMLTWLRLGKPHPMLVMLFSGGAGVLLYGI